MEEQISPVLQPGGASIARRFKLTAKNPPDDLFLLAASGKSIAHTGTSSWLADTKLSVSVSVSGKGAGESMTRENGGQTQLLVPVHFTNGTAEIKINLNW